MMGRLTNSQGASLDRAERDLRRQEMATASRNDYWAAVDWCERFMPRSKAQLAASSVLMLRSIHGAGAVTREMVLERCEFAWPPEIWSELAQWLAENTNERSTAA
jgi:hypothetical protein